MRKWMTGLLVLGVACVAQADPGWDEGCWPVREAPVPDMPQPIDVEPAVVEEPPYDPDDPEASGFVCGGDAPEGCTRCEHPAPAPMCAGYQARTCFDCGEQGFMCWCGFAAQAPEPPPPAMPEPIESIADGTAEPTEQDRKIGRAVSAYQKTDGSEPIESFVHGYDPTIAQDNCITTGWWPPCWQSCCFDNCWPQDVIHTCCIDEWDVINCFGYDCSTCGEGV